MLSSAPLHRRGRGEVRAGATVPRSAPRGGVRLYFFYPSTVLVEAADTKQLLRIYPGKHPGESVVDIAYSVTSAPTQEDWANHLLSFEFVKGLLCNEDFPMAEQCQRGLSAGRDCVVVGRNEPLLQHLHSRWIDGVAAHHRSERSFPEALDA